MISVVIPVRNRAGLVGRTLQSLEAQTLAPDAIYLVDNGSTDGTLDVLRCWAAGRGNVRVLEEPQPGATYARNAGLACVQTPYVMFFDSDDVMPPRHIEQIMTGLRASNLPKIGVFDMELVRLDGSVSPQPYRRGNPMAMQIFHSILSTQRCVVSTDYARSAGGWNTALAVWNDYELGVRLLVPRPTLAYLPLERPVVAYAQAESITGTNFASKAGQWEQALDACRRVLRGTGYERLIDYRRAILAGMYRREGHAELAKGMVTGLRLSFVERYVAAGGRGVAYLAKLLG